MKRIKFKEKSGKITEQKENIFLKVFGIKKDPIIIGKSFLQNAYHDEVKKGNPNEASFSVSCLNLVHAVLSFGYDSAQEPFELKQNIGSLVCIHIATSDLQ